MKKTPLVILLFALSVTTGACFTANPGEQDVLPPIVESEPEAAPEEVDDATVAKDPEPANGIVETTDRGDTSDLAPSDEAPAEEIRDPAEIQREALDLCQSASEFLDQGEVEDAIASLDRAYQLMLDLPNNGDTTFLQEKEDIRVMVADLIVQTYDSVRSVAKDAEISWDLELQIVENDHVKREIKSFTNGEGQFFLDSYRRSGLYRSMMVTKLEEAGLPSQLSWLPLVESGFKVRALSRASALGLWQFISSTGLRYGLTRDTWVDLRIDPEASTDAAIAYLLDLHGLFGDWPKALAAYNCGEGRVLRLQRRNPDEFLDFWDLYAVLPRETRRYVPRLYAALAIVENPGKYGVTLPDPMPGLGPVETAKINRSVKLADLDGKLGLEKGTLHSLNPALRHKATPNREFNLKVPEGVGDVLRTSIESVAVWSPPTPQYVTHRVRRGETLGGIASRYSTSVSAIMRVNRIRSAHRIWPGQRLKIPARGGSRTAPSTGTFDAAEGTHTVRRGESLYSIASRYNSTVARLKKDNKLKSNLIKPGQKLVVKPGSRGNLRRHKVQKGDTLGKIAQAHGVSLSSLLRSNGLGSRSKIFPRQVLVIPDR